MFKNDCESLKRTPLWNIAAQAKTGPAMIFSNSQKQADVSVLFWVSNHHTDTPLKCSIEAWKWPHAISITESCCRQMWGGSMVAFCSVAPHFMLEQNKHLTHLYRPLNSTISTQIGRYKVLVKSVKSKLLLRNLTNICTNDISLLQISCFGW